MHHASYGSETRRNLGTYPSRSTRSTFRKQALRHFGPIMTIMSMDRLTSDTLNQNVTRLTRAPTPIPLSPPRSTVPCSPVSRLPSPGLPSCPRSRVPTSPERHKPWLLAPWALVDCVPNVMQPRHPGSLGPLTPPQGTGPYHLPTPALHLPCPVSTVHPTSSLNPQSDFQVDSEG